MVEGLGFLPIIGESESVPSTDVGSEIINHIELHGISAHALLSAGQLPPGIGFDSNHKAMYADMTLDETL